MNSGDIWFGQTDYFSRRFARDRQPRAILFLFFTQWAGPSTVGLAEPVSLMPAVGTDSATTMCASLKRGRALPSSLTSIRPMWRRLQRKFSNASSQGFATGASKLIIEYRKFKEVDKGMNVKLATRSFAGGRRRLPSLNAWNKAMASICQHGEDVKAASTYLTALGHGGAE